MIGSLIALACVLGGEAAAPARPVVAVSDSLEQLYDAGRSWPEFAAAARANRSLWTGNYAKGAPGAAAIERARAVPGMWRILVVAEDRCLDSANTVPYVARLVDEIPTLELRIVNSTEGKWVMERHRTPDGRAATPTILILDAAFEDRGCFVERPAKLRAWAAARKGKMSDAAYRKAKLAWYRADRGRETVKEIIDRLAAAAAGTPKCGGPD